MDEQNVVVTDAAVIEAIKAAKKHAELLRVVGLFEDSFSGRSFSGRHPELGKMIKCLCGRRHRSSEVHEQVFAKDENGNPRVAPIPRIYRPSGNSFGWRLKPNPQHWAAK